MSARLSDEQRDELALALHKRWHGNHGYRLHGGTERQCAEMSGAYDDVAAIEPIVLGLMKRGK